MLNKVCVDDEQNVLLQTLEYGYLSETHFLIRLRRRFSVSRFTTSIRIYKFSVDDLYMSRSDCADTGLSNAIRVYAHICACPNKAAQRYRCSHVHLASSYYVVIKPAFLHRQPAFSRLPVS